MKVVVVYESHWGNTAAIARAIAEGIGPAARVLSTGEASPATLADADLVVAGAPVNGFSLPTEKMRENIVSNSRTAPTPPDMTGPSMRAWLEKLPKGHARSAAFETRIRWSPGGATSSIAKGLEHAGYRTVAKPEKFIVKGSYGPLAEGEAERARQWGAELAKSMS